MRGIWTCDGKSKKEQTIQVWMQVVELSPCNQSVQTTEKALKGRPDNAPQMELAHLFHKANYSGKVLGAA